MPQLNPEPWLTTLLITWISFIAFLQPKITSPAPVNDPTTRKPPTIKTWPWPWTQTCLINS
ncbi:ATP synthase F0 subunit 8 (mitochondrion) [Alligator sinensis]|uniref:ATP synthase complex subunit 8 n=1 Tax=Alligator sinensis TaxID=38654 RepID=Q8HG45_ALLSI|nr:ATP synthase subunit 8 [Alligator sinensis]